MNHFTMNLPRGILIILVVLVIVGINDTSCLAQKNEIWQRTYGLPDRFDIINSAKSTYDNGFILGIASTINSPSEYLTWLIKTDINGNVIWSKSLINSDQFFLIKSIDIDENENIIFTGSTNQYDANRDVFIMRLNACGEKVWCKVIRYNDMNYGYRVKIRSDGNYAVYTRYAAISYYDANQLWVIDTNGIILSSFHIVPPGTHPNIGAPLVEDFIITNDNGYLFSGHCYFPLDTLNPQIWRLQHMLVKFDSNGVEQWIRPQYLDTNQEGVILCTKEQNEIFYSIGYDYGYSDNKLLKSFSIRPYNGKFNENGQLIFEKRLHPDTLQTFLYYLNPITDSTLIQTGKITHDTSGEPPYYMGVFKTDTMFNILNYLGNDSGSVTNECITSSVDGKFLITGYCPPESSYTEVDGFAIKVNNNLEYDTLYTYPFIYDSLCPFPIPTDTIDCDCDVITGFGEPVKPDERYKIHVYPNPAQQKVTVHFNDLSGMADQQEKTLLLYDLFGRMILETTIRSDAQLDVGRNPSGIYVLTIRQQDIILARKKLVVL